MSENIDNILKRSFNASLSRMIIASLNVDFIGYEERLKQAFETVDKVGDVGLQASMYMDLHDQVTHESENLQRWLAEEGAYPPSEKPPKVVKTLSL